MTNQDLPSQIRENAAKEGIGTEQIPLRYQGLDPAEIAAMKLRNIYVRELPTGEVLARFLPDGSALYPEKCVGHLYIAG